MVDTTPLFRCDRCGQAAEEEALIRCGCGFAWRLFCCDHYEDWTWRPNSETDSGYLCPHCGSWATEMDSDEVSEDLIRGRPLLLDYKRADRICTLCGDLFSESGGTCIAFHG